MAKFLNICVRCGVVLIPYRVNGKWMPASTGGLPCPVHEPSPLFRCRYCNRLLRPPMKPYGAKWLTLEPVDYPADTGLSPHGGCNLAPADLPARHFPVKVRTL